MPLSYTRFRGQRTAAPLKHACSGGYKRIIKRFPRSKNRGPIEAHTSTIGGNTGMRFRGQRTAAPLKRPYAARPWAIRTGFRGQRTAAPLKLRAAAAVMPPVPPVSAVKEPRPH